MPFLRGQVPHPLSGWKAEDRIGGAVCPDGEGRRGWLIVECGWMEVAQTFGGEWKD